MPGALMAASRGQPSRPKLGPVIGRPRFFNGRGCVRLAHPSKSGRLQRDFQACGLADASDPERQDAVPENIERLVRRHAGGEQRLAEQHGRRHADRDDAGGGAAVVAGELSTDPVDEFLGFRLLSADRSARIGLSAAPATVVEAVAVALRGEHNSSRSAERFGAGRFGFALAHPILVRFAADQLFDAGIVRAGRFALLLEFVEHGAANFAVRAPFVDRGGGFSHFHLRAWTYTSIDGQPGDGIVAICAGFRRRVFNWRKTFRCQSGRSLR